jgi:hypothetical protein
VIVVISTVSTTSPTQAVVSAGRLTGCWPACVLRWCMQAKLPTAARANLFMKTLPNFLAKPW